MTDRFLLAAAGPLGAVLLALTLLAGCSTDASSDRVPEAGGATDPDAPRVLVFSKTEGYRHEAIPTGIRMMHELGKAHGFAVTATEDAGAFTAERLSGVAAVVFLNTTGDVLGAAQEEAFREYVEGGGGFVGVHAATDTEYEWPWYNRLVGAYFDGHPSVQEATLTVVDDAHPSTSALPTTWTRTDEWYSFRAINDAINVLVTIDEDSYDLQGAPAMGEHPVAWYHEVGDGRSWYTALGHTKAAYGDADFREHVLGGLRWAAGLEAGASNSAASGPDGS